MELENLKKQINYLFELDDKFLNLDNDFIIDNDLEILSSFMDERVQLIQSINSALGSGVKLDKESAEYFINKVNEHTSLLTTKTLSIQALVKSRIITTNKFKSAHLYFHNNQSNPIFIDKTI